MTRKSMDKVGRIVIPIEVRKQLKWNENEILEMEVNQERNELIMKKTKHHCVACGAEQNLIAVKKGVELCRDCLASAIKAK